MTREAGDVKMSAADLTVLNFLKECFYGSEAAAKKYEQSDLAAQELKLVKEYQDKLRADSPLLKAWMTSKTDGES